MDISNRGEKLCAEKGGPSAWEERKLTYVSCAPKCAVCLEPSYPSKVAFKEDASSFVGRNGPLPLVRGLLSIQISKRCASYRCASINRRYIERSMGSKVAPGILVLSLEEDEWNWLGISPIFQIARKAKMPKSAQNRSLP